MQKQTKSLIRTLKNLRRAQTSVRLLILQDSTCTWQELAVAGLLPEAAAKYRKEISCEYAEALRHVTKFRGEQGQPQQTT